MGSYISKVMYSRTKKVLILGHEGSGKTTIYRILNKKYNTKPRDIDQVQGNGFNVDIIKNMVIWDLSGKKTMVPFWSCYFNNVDGVVWVFDPSSKKCNEILEMMYSLLSSVELCKVKILVFIHKSDLVGEMVSDKIKEKIFLMFPGRSIRILSTCVKDHEAIYEGYEWIYETVNIHKGKKLYLL